MLYRTIGMLSLLGLACCENLSRSPSFLPLRETVLAKPSTSEMTAESGKGLIRIECSTASIPLSSSRIPLKIEVANADTVAHYITGDDPQMDFAVWLSIDGSDVALTEFGRTCQPRVIYYLTTESTGFVVRPSEVKCFEIDLKKLFVLERRGHYSVVVARAIPIPYWSKKTIVAHGSFDLF